MINVSPTAATKINELLAEEGKAAAGFAYSCRVAAARASSTV